jgi:deoxyribose-phosphate aldolase
MRILSIQSSVAYGYVGNSAATFPLQRLGHEVWPVNTVHFSNHTGYGAWRGQVLEPAIIADVIEGIFDRGVLETVDAILTGYQGSPGVADVVLSTLEHGFDAAIVPPCWVTVARDELRGTVARIGSIVDYPNGSALTSVRVDEVRALVDAGVDELDATVNVGFLLSSRIPEFAADIAAVVAAAEPVGVKLMLELPMLNTRQREHAVTAAIEAGAAFVSIASRGSVGIADPATISYLRKAVPASIGVKASGGVKTVEQVRALLAAGADLIGTSAGIHIVTGVGAVKGSLYSY